MATARSLRAHDDRGLTPVVALLGLAAVAWPLTVDRMAGMDTGPGADPGRLGWFVVTWVLMMGAMMLPALVPAARAGGGNAAFVGGYLGVWTGAGVALYAVVEAVRAADPAWLAWDSAGRWLAAGAILAAAIYQLSAAKGACLDRCRSSSGAVAVAAARRGAASAGALRDGVRHGAACVGCCAGLVAVLFVLGVMSLTWMVVVTVLIAAERLLPWRTPAVYGVAAVLAVVAVWIAVDPASLPGLTLPMAPMPMGGM